MVLCGYETASPHLYTGLFQIDDAGVCLQANPATGDCQCDGSESVAGIWRANVDAASKWKGSNIVSCLAAARDAAPAAPLSSSSDALQISGMYQHDDAVAGGKGCRSVNPFTGNCSYTPFPPPSSCVVVHCFLYIKWLCNHEFIEIEYKNKKNQRQSGVQEGFLPKKYSNKLLSPYTHTHH